MPAGWLGFDYPYGMTRITPTIAARISAAASTLSLGAPGTSRVWPQALGRARLSTHRHAGACRLLVGALHGRSLGGKALLQDLHKIDNVFARRHGAPGGRNHALLLVTQHRGQGGAVAIF